MHIAFLSPEYPHPELNRVGGLGTSIKNSAVELKKNNVSVSVFVYGQDSDAVFDDNGITIHKIGYKSYSLFGWYLYRKHIQNYVNKQILVNKIDIVEAPDWTGITAFMNLKCTIVIRLHGSDAYFCSLEYRKQKFKNYFFEKKALLGADKIVSVSLFTAEKTNEVFGINKCKDVIHNGINTDYFKPLSETINKNQILYFGTLIRKKGVLELAHAFNLLIKECPSVSLLLLGKDVIDVFEKKSTLELFFEILSESARKRVTHMNEVHYSEVARIVAKANLVTLPSFAEAFPMTWLEAMAMEKALVTSNIGWANEIMIDEVTGFTIAPRNHIEYANKMKMLLNDDLLSIQCGKEARNRVLEMFNSQLITEQNKAMYKSITN